MPELGEPVSFAKGRDDTVEGYGMPYFGPVQHPDGIGRDFDGEYFSPNTDFLLGWYKGDRPTLYHHTMDGEIGTDPVGWSTDYERRDDGMWVRSQLDIRSRYYEALRALIKQGALSYSSGAYPTGVQVAKSGEILRWPWVEMSLTPTPANPYASLRSFKTVGDLLVPDVAPRILRLRPRRVAR